MSTLTGEPFVCCIVAPTSAPERRKKKENLRVEEDPYLLSDVLLTPSVDSPLIPPPTLPVFPLSLSSSPPKSLPSPCCVLSPPHRCLSEAPFQLPHNNSGLPHTLSLALCASPSISAVSSPSITRPPSPHNTPLLIIEPSLLALPVLLLPRVFSTQRVSPSLTMLLSSVSLVPQLCFFPAPYSSCLLQHSVSKRRPKINLHRFLVGNSSSFAFYKRHLFLGISEAGWD